MFCRRQEFSWPSIGWEDNDSISILGELLLQQIMKPLCRSALSFAWRLNRPFFFPACSDNDTIYNQRENSETKLLVRGLLQQCQRYVTRFPAASTTTLRTQEGNRLTQRTSEERNTLQHFTMITAKPGAFLIRTFVLFTACSWKKRR